jgi:hypothetical protein
MEAVVLSIDTDALFSEKMATLVQKAWCAGVPHIRGDMILCSNMCRRQPSTHAVESIGRSAMFWGQKNLMFSTTRNEQTENKCVVWPDEQLHPPCINISTSLPHPTLP